MDDVNLLVIFYSRSGLTERLAVLVGEGAIQEGAKIRLRRSRDLMPDEVIAADEAWRSERDRMHKEYAAPRLEDVAWADVVAFGTPAAPGSVGAELGATLSQIATLGKERLGGKAATAFTSSYGALAGAELALSELQSRLLRLGVVALPVPEEAGTVRSETSLVVHQFLKVGYKRFSLMRALAVVKRQSTLVAVVLR